MLSTFRCFPLLRDDRDITQARPGRSKKTLGRSRGGGFGIITWGQVERHVGVVGMRAKVTEPNVMVPLVCLLIQYDSYEGLGFRAEGLGDIPEVPSLKTAQSEQS